MLSIPQASNNALEYLEELQPNSSDYIRVKQKIINDFSFYPSLQITGVFKVKNSYLKVMYDNKKLEYESKYPGKVKELELFHSTSASKAYSIVKDNFDWRLVNRSMFGRGTSFSNNANYANCHANRQNGFSRALLVCYVLVANIAEGDSSTIQPPAGYDTTGSPNRMVLVKYDDHEFLPRFVAFYNCPDALINQSEFYRNWRSVV